MDPRTKNHARRSGSDRMKISRDDWAIIAVALICAALILPLLTKWEIPEAKPGSAPIRSRAALILAQNVAVYQARAEGLKLKGISHIEAYEQAAKEQCEARFWRDIKW